ncbi:MAG: membrane protein insertase YidC [Clostridia bacterium]|nr:membrane protein insertase YidC [Clostridia bacterium]
MMGIFSIFAKPLGYVMQWIYQLGLSYFMALLLFTFLVRLVLFPLSIKNQKNQADRARLAPRLERIQKKYGQDRQKLMEKQQALYEKEGVKMTGGCLPMLVQMLVLFSVIAVIYKPLTYMQRIPEAQINACVKVAVESLDKDDKSNKELLSQLENEKSYYRELYLFKHIEKNHDAMVDRLVSDCKVSETEAEQTIAIMQKTGEEFSVFGISLLEVPKDYGIKPNWLWIIVLASGLSAFTTSMLSMKYSKATMPKDQQQMAGCSTNMMMYMMPVMSLVFSFTVPAGVAVYWTFSNLLAMVQTVTLNAMWNPAKIRAQAEAEYAERRRKKAEDKARLKEARLAEQAAWQKEENEKRAQAKGDITKKKTAKTPATPADLPKEIVDEIPEEPVDAEEEKV